MKVKINEETVKHKLRFRIRLDFRGEEKAGRFFFGSKTSAEMANDVRKEQINQLKNVPLKGLTFEDLDQTQDIYFLQEDDHHRKQEAAYAPLVITVKAEHIEDVFPLLFRPEFKKIEVLGPENVHLERYELERLLYSICQDFYR